MLIYVPALDCRLSATQVLKLPQGLAVERGQHWCVFGSNGAGKSVLLQLLLGRLPQARGALGYASDFDPLSDICEVSFEEQQRLCALDNRFDISEFNKTAQDAGTRVENLICDGPVLHSDAARLEHILELLDIQHIRRQGIRYLSSGQMRRAMIARALYLKPLLLVLDNPLESIDRYSADKIRGALTQWMGPHNATLFMCRREQQMLAGVTQVLLMDNLQAVGLYTPEAFQTARSARLRTLSPVQLPTQLPKPCAGRKAADLPTGYEHEALISLRGVSAAYGEQSIFKDLHFDMHRGDHVLLEGPNGCGKSTLLDLIDGDNHKAYGQPVYLFGRRRGSGESVWDIKARFGVVSNDLHQRYVKGWRVLDVVVSGFFDSLGLYDDSGASEARCAREWLALFGLLALDREYYHTLSFGQQRLVLLARAMVKQPLILVLDEPCTGLDDYHCELLLRMVDFIAAQGRTQILFVSHSADDVPGCITTKLRFTVDEHSGSARCHQDTPRSRITVHRYQTQLTPVELTTGCR